MENIATPSQNKNGLLYLLNVILRIYCHYNVGAPMIYSDEYKMHFVTELNESLFNMPAESLLVTSLRSPAFVLSVRTICSHY